MKSIFKLALRIAWVGVILFSNLVFFTNFTSADFSAASEFRISPNDGVPYDYFGTSVAVNGNTAVVGAYYKDSGKGAVYIFNRNGTSWNLQAKLTASDGVNGDSFGASVDIDGDTVVIGAPQVTPSNGKGAVYVFIRTGSTWSQQARLTASDGVEKDNFGNRVAINGDTVVTGASSKNTNTGAAYVFTRSGTTWSQQAKLVASDARNYDNFGTSVDIHNGTIVTGATYNARSATGAAYVFVFNNNSWGQQAILTANDAAASDSFGRSVSINGDYALVGAYGKNGNTGASYIFLRSGTTWSQQAKLTASDAASGDLFGLSVSISGDKALVGANGKNSNTGAAYLFTRSGTTWSQQPKFTASDAATGDSYGWQVYLTNYTIAVGAPFKNNRIGVLYTYIDIVPPSATANAATTVTATSATLNGNLTSMGSATNVNVSFEYGTTTGYGSVTPTQAMTATGAFSASVTGLAPGTTYHLRAKADGGAMGIATSPDMTFTSSVAPPSVISNAATNTTTNSATLNGNLTSLGSAANVNVSFEYGTTTSYGSVTPIQAMTATGVFSANITGLTPGATYHFRIKADGGTHGISYGSDMTIIVTTTPPVVTTGAATSITASSATLNGNLTSLGTASSVNVSFEYGTTTSYGSVTPAQAMTAAGAFSANITGLTPGSTYHFRVKADGGISGTATGSDMIITTSIIPPTANAGAATSITANSATLNGNLDSLGTATTVNVSFEYGTTTNYGNVTSTQVRTSAGAFNANITGLTPGATYHFRAKVDGGSFGTTTSSDVTFATTTTPPSVSVSEAKFLASTSATLNGNLTSLGTSKTINVFFEYGTSTNYGNATATQVMTIAGIFNANLTGLAPGTTYHFRAKADGSSHGITNSTDMTFTTGKAGIPPYIWVIVIALAVLAIGAVTVIAIKKKAGPIEPPTRVPKPATTSTQPPVIQAGQPDYIDKLKKLTDMKNLGLITDEEFANKKKDILDKM